MLIDLIKIKKKYKIGDVSISHFGAHKGQEVNNYLDLNFFEIYLYEPQKIFYDELKKNYSQYKNVFIFQKGIGNENIEKELIIDNLEGQSASFLNPSLHKKYFPKIKFNKKELVEIIKYDFENIYSNFLVLDLQGYELEALKGSRQRLNDSVEYVICEIFREELYENSPLFNDIDEYLKQFGFIRVETVWSTNSLYKYGDGFYIKRSNLNKLKIFNSQFKNFINNRNIIFNLKIIVRRIIFKLKNL